MPPSAQNSSDLEAIMNMFYNSDAGLGGQQPSFTHINPNQCSVVVPWIRWAARSATSLLQVMKRLLIGPTADQQCGFECSFAVAAAVSLPVFAFGRRLPTRPSYCSRRRCTFLFALERIAKYAGDPEGCGAERGFEGQEGRNHAGWSSSMPARRTATSVDPSQTRRWNFHELGCQLQGLAICKLHGDSRSSYRMLQLSHHQDTIMAS